LDSATLLFLLAGHHISVEERVRRGLSPSKPLRYGRLVSEVAREARRCGQFPPTAVPVEELMGDGVVIVREGIFYVCHSHQAFSLDPRVNVRRARRRFLFASNAPKFYLQRNLGIEPGRRSDLDWWPVSF
jgi:hypothetical protein